MTHRTPVAAVLAMAVALTLAAGPAAAACCSGSATDPDDVRGRLDIAAVAWEKDTAGAPVRITVRTHGDWRSRVLRGGSGNRLVVLIDSDADPEIDYRARIRRADGDLLVFMSGEGNSYEPLPATRPNAHSVRFTIPGGGAPNPSGGLQLFARSRYVDDGACASACADRAPDSGRA